MKIRFAIVVSAIAQLVTQEQYYSQTIVNEMLLQSRSSQYESCVCTVVCGRLYSSCLSNYVHAILEACLNNTYT